MPAPDDSALVGRARRGDAGAYETLFRRYHGMVFRLCRTYTRTDEDAMDLAQDSFVKAFAGLDRLTEAAAFSGWLATIARNAGRDAVSRRQRSPEVSGEAPETADPCTLEDRALRAEARRLTGDIIAAMPDGRPRQVAELFYLQDQEVAEISERLEISVSNVTTTLGRARAWLRKHLLVQLRELRGYSS